jgi:superfamily II DNA or RNA helicase
LSFLTEEIIKGTNWRAVERAVARLMSHCGWEDVSIVGKSGDKGADIIATREKDGAKRIWVVQVKAVTGGNYVGISALDEVLRAQAFYRANTVVVATNGSFTDSVKIRKEKLIKSGFDVKIWNGHFLRILLAKSQLFHHKKRALRNYQQRIVEGALQIFDAEGQRIQYVVATGLGKTVIAAEIVAEIWRRKQGKFLVLCHSRDLALQLEQSFWGQLPKNMPTRFFFDGFPPVIYKGVNFGLYQSLQGYLSGISPKCFDVVIVDEAHHALAYGFRSCIEHLSPNFLIGMTATPWRGDGQSIDTIFGEPISRISLIDGMAMGFLSKVDYRLFCDNINWKIIPDLSQKRLTIRDLNKRLFLPQRDEAIVSITLKEASKIPAPRIAVFSPSIEHANRFANILSAGGLPCKSLSGIQPIERRNRLMDFSIGKLKAVTAVDVMNEGIDVPDINLLVFLRATHSRRIFIQQLGRGLRLATGKEKVVVLDFVSDIRRFAEIIEFNREAVAKGNKFENLYLKNGIVNFNDQESQKFIESWLEDVANLSSIEETEKLSFPDFKWP